MGYSATQDAIHALAVIYQAYGDPASSNVLILRGERYFYEIGQEQEDGSVTGRLWKMLGDDSAQITGQFKISAEGEIVRFPKLSHVQKQELGSCFRDMSARNPELLRQWAMGRV